MQKWLYPVTCMLISISLAACGTNNETGPTNKQHTQNVANQGSNQLGANGDQAAPAPLNKTGLRNFGYARSGQKTQAHTGNKGPHNTRTNQAGVFDQNLSNRIAQAADNVPGVEGATAVVRGNDVIVGINTRVTNTTATQQTVIERQVHSAVRTIAPTHRIRVTSDATMVTRIRSLATNVTGFGKDMTNGPDTVGANLTRAGQDFMMLVRDLGRTATAPFR